MDQLKTLDEAAKLFFTDGVDECKVSANYIEEKFSAVVKQALNGDIIRKLTKLINQNNTERELNAFSTAAGFDHDNPPDFDNPENKEKLQKATEAVFNMQLSGVLSALVTGVIIGIEMTGFDVKQLPVPVEVKAIDETPTADDLEKLFALDSGEDLQKAA